MRKKLTRDQISARLSADRARAPVWGLLDNIRSLYNVGSIFRTSDGAFIQGLSLTGFTPTPPRKEIEKTALGATATIPWTYYRDPLDAVRAARDAGYTICVLEQTTESLPYHRLTKASLPLCLVVGNELTGVSQRVIAEADLAIEIPMNGTKHSLNAAVAYGIALFECVRVWKEP
jgi:23S rRNA (guanosine2251-2'-O)-methyltransferase